VLPIEYRTWTTETNGENAKENQRRCDDQHHQADGQIEGPLQKAVDRAEIEPSEKTSQPRSIRLISTRRNSCSTKLRYCTTGKPAFFARQQLLEIHPAALIRCDHDLVGADLTSGGQHVQSLGAQDLDVGIACQPRIDRAKRRSCTKRMS